MILFVNQISLNGALLLAQNNEDYNLISFTDSFLLHALVTHTKHSTGITDKSRLTYRLIL